MRIKLIFTCGHQEFLDERVAGDLKDRPVCSIDGAALEMVVAPKPTFKIAGVSDGDK